MSDDKEWNDGYYLEGMDRLDGVVATISARIVNHPAIVKAQAQDKVTKAMDLLLEAYQDIGATEFAHTNFDEKN